MRSLFFTLAAVAAFSTVVFAASTAKPTIVMPDKIQWHAEKGGFSDAVLYGNPDKGGFWTVRLKAPANWKFPAHHHPGNEYVTVISGTFYAGLGDKMDASSAIAFPAGSFVAMPANVVHYAMTKNEPVVIQISGTGVEQNIMEKM